MQVTGTSTEGLAGVISALNDTAKSVEIETFTADQLAPILGELSDGGRDVLLALAGALDWQPAAEGAAARRGLTAGRHSYLRRIDEVVAARKVKYIEAVRIVKREHPALFQSYTSRRRRAPSQ